MKGKLYPEKKKVLKSTDMIETVNTGIALVSLFVTCILILMYFEVKIGVAP